MALFHFSHLQYGKVGVESLYRFQFSFQNETTTILACMCCHCAILTPGFILSCRFEKKLGKLCNKFETLVTLCSCHFTHTLPPSHPPTITPTITPSTITPSTITPSHRHTFPPSHHSQFPQATWALSVASCRVVWQRQLLLSRGWTECYHKWSRCHSPGGEHQPIETPAYGPVTIMCNSTQSFIVPHPLPALDCS